MGSNCKVVRPHVLDLNSTTREEVIDEWRRNGMVGVRVSDALLDTFHRARSACRQKLGSYDDDNVISCELDELGDGNMLLDQLREQQSIIVNKLMRIVGGLALLP